MDLATSLLNDKTDISSNVQIRLNENVPTNNPCNTWQEFVFQKISEKNFSTLLEVGCGNGLLWKKNEHQINNNWNIHLSDSSPNVVHEAQANLCHLSNINFWVFPITGIAFNDNIFNVVLANQMLHRVNNISAALTEIKRVLAQDGIFYAASGTIHHQKELFDFIADATGVLIPNDIQSFTNHNAVEPLSNFFDTIDITYYKDELKIHDDDALIDYFSALRSIKTQDSLFKSKLFEYIRQYFLNHEFFSITKEFVLFTCSDL